MPGYRPPEPEKLGYFQPFPPMLPLRVSVEVPETHRPGPSSRRQDDNSQEAPFAALATLATTMEYLSVMAITGEQTTEPSPRFG